MKAQRSLPLGASKPQFGICSDEKVVHPAHKLDDFRSTRLSLWGFNDVKPFFTANHVFHTTTGMRSINPHAARVENPWADIGRLQVGHVLLHTEDGKNYKPVPIVTINHEEAQCESVHGVHLRSGLRSYHANGYLVHLNYPEITIKSMSKLLLPLPQQKRLELLKQFKELQPLFARFGAETVVDALQKEVERPASQPNLLGRSKPPFPKRGAQHIRRSWSLKDDGIPQVSRKLPSVMVNQGVVSIDGKYVPQARVTTDRIFRSRPIGGGHWEHGYINLFSNLSSGAGAIAYAPKGVTPNISDPKSLRPFHARPQSQPLTSRIQQQQTKKALISSTLKAVASPAYEVMDEYTVSYDTAPWVTGNTVPTSPADYLTIYDTTVGDLDEFSARIPVLDQLRDKLVEQWQSENGTDLENVPELYECWDGLDEDSNPILYFQMLQPELIAQAANGYVEDQSKSYKNLKFSNLGLDFELPFIFDQMRLVMSWDAVELAGVIRAFDPTMVGQMGERTLASGEYIDPSLTAVRQQNAMTSLNSKSKTSTQDMLAAHLEPPEFLATMALGDSAIPTDNAQGAQELKTSIKMSPDDVHEATQRLLYRVVLFHMSDDDLTNFAGERRPVQGKAIDQVPQELGSNLSSELAHWLQSTYIPLWIAKRVISTDEKTQSQWRQQFTNAEKKRIDYFWNGKGKTCLSQCPKYKLLNQICATQALRTTYSRLAQYADDIVPDPLATILDPKAKKPILDPKTQKPIPNPTYNMAGGKRWATVLYNIVSAKPAFNTLCAQYKTNTATVSKWPLLGLCVADCHIKQYGDAQKLCNSMYTA